MTNGSVTNFYEQSPASGSAPKQMVLLLHGLGSNGRDLMSLAPYWAQSLPDAVFISPDAPFACDMVPPGYPDSYQWFSLMDRDPQKILQGAQEAHPVLQEFVKRQLERYGLPAGALALTGFSQGAMMSLYTGLRYPEKIAGVLGYSGALIGMEEGCSRIPVHLIHGEDDDVVPVDAYHAAQQTLKDFGFTVSGYTTPGLPHSIDQNGIESGAEFLRSVFAYPKE